MLCLAAVTKKAPVTNASVFSFPTTGPSVSPLERGQVHCDTNCREFLPNTLPPNICFECSKNATFSHRPFWRQCGTKRFFFPERSLVSSFLKTGKEPAVQWQCKPNPVPKLSQITLGKRHSEWNLEKHYWPLVLSIRSTANTAIRWPFLKSRGRTKKTS